MKRTLWILTLAVAALAQAPNRAEVQLQAAINKETVEGDLKSAINLYRKVAADHRANRSVAARALLRLAEAQEKLGESEARKAYEQIVRDYADQQPASVARTRLAALLKATPSARLLIEDLPNWFAASPNPVSPDGRSLFVAAKINGESRIPALLDLATGRERQLPRPPGFEFIDTGVLSVDNQMLVYTAQAGGNTVDLIVANGDGSNPRSIFKTGGAVAWFYPVGITPDKKSIVIRFNRPRGQTRQPSYHLGRVDVASGEMTVVRETTAGLLGTPSLSPDGNWIAFSLQARPDSPNHDIHVIRTDGTSESVIVDNAADDDKPVWSPGGKGILFVSNRTGSLDLWYVPVDAGKRAGPEQRIHQGIGNAELLGVSPSGTLVYRLAIYTPTFLHSTLDNSGAFRPFQRLEESFSGIKRQPNLSFDGSRIAYIREPDYAKGRVIIGIRDIAAGRERELLPNLRFVQVVLWMPDGRRLFVNGADRNGQWGQFLVDAESGQFTPLPAVQFPNSYRGGGGLPVLSPDGKTGYYPTYRRDNGAIFACDLATGNVRLVIEGRGFTNAPSLSPDGQWIAFFDNGKEKVSRIVPTAGGPARDLPSGIRVYGWTPDSKHLYVTNEGVDDPRTKQARLFRMPVEGGPLTPVSPLLDRPDNLQVVGNAAIYRERLDRREIWAIDNVLAGVK